MKSMFRLASFRAMKTATPSSAVTTVMMKTGLRKGMEWKIGVEKHFYISEFFSIGILLFWGTPQAGLYHYRGQTDQQADGQRDAEPLELIVADDVKHNRGQNAGQVRVDDGREDPIVAVA